MKKKDSEFKPQEPKIEVSDNPRNGGEHAGLRAEIEAQLEHVGYFEENDPVKKKITLLEVVGQIAPNIDYKLKVKKFPLLADELKVLFQKAFEQSFNGRDDALDLLQFLDLVYDAP